jgi:hypothetical protein
MRALMFTVVLLFVVTATVVADDRLQVTTTIEEMSKFYQSNEARFDEQYVEKWVTVSGKLDSIRKGPNTGIYVVEFAQKEQTPFRLVFLVSLEHRKKLAEFSVGDDITMRGVCRGLSSPRDPSLQIVFDMAEPAAEVVTVEPKVTKDTEKQLAPNETTVADDATNGTLRLMFSAAPTDKGPMVRVRFGELQLEASEIKFPLRGIGEYLSVTATEEKLNFRHNMSVLSVNKVEFDDQQFSFRRLVSAINSGR